MPNRLNAKHETFAQALASGIPVGAAYVEAGFKRNPGNAFRLSRKEYIQKRVEVLRGQKASFVSAAVVETGITVARTLEELARIGFSDIGDMFTKGGCLKPVNDLPESIRRAVSSIKVVTRRAPGTKTEDGGDPEVEFVTEIRLWDKGSALEKIGRYLQMFVEAKAAETDMQQQMLDFMKTIVSPNSALPVNAGQHLRLVRSYESPLRSTHAGPADNRSSRDAEELPEGA